MLLVERFGPILACRWPSNRNARSLLWTRHEAAPFFTLLYAGGSRAKFYQKGSQMGQHRRYTNPPDKTEAHAAEHTNYKKPTTSQPRGGQTKLDISARHHKCKQGPVETLKFMPRALPLGSVLKQGRETVQFHPPGPGLTGVAGGPIFFTLRSGLNKYAK